MGLTYSYCRDFNDGDIEDEIREAFRMFDKEGNGFITSVGNKANFPVIFYLFYHVDLMEIMTSIGDVLSFEEADVSLKTLTSFKFYQVLTGVDRFINNWAEEHSHCELFYQELIAEADVDGDGNINYEEFVGTIFKGVGFMFIWL